MEDKNIFGSKKQDIPPPVSDGKAMRAIKVIDEKISNLDKKTELIENNILSINKKQNIELKTLHSKMMGMEKEINLIKRRIVEIVSDLKNFARTEEIETVKKYLELWEPLNFVTREELNELINEKLQNRKV